MNSKSFVRLASLLGALAAALAVAYSQTKTQDAKKPEIKSTAAKSPAVIGYLQTRDHWITIKADGRYTIADKEGKVVAENVSLKELQASNPRLHGILERAVASGKRIPDARLRKSNQVSPSLILPHNDARNIRDTRNNPFQSRAPQFGPVR